MYILESQWDTNVLLETKQMLSCSFDMKDLGEAHYVLGIEILRDRSRGILGLSQKTYIDRILKKVQFAVLCSWESSNFKR